MTATCIRDVPGTASSVLQKLRVTRPCRVTRSRTQMPCARFARRQPEMGFSYLLGLITIGLPPKLNSLLRDAAQIAPAIAPPAASRRAASAPPLNLPKVSALVSLVQRVPGAA